MLADKLRAAALSEAAIQFVASAFTQRTTASTSLTISKPTGTVQGDLMVAFMANDSGATQTWTGDTGWTEIADEGSGAGLRLAYKVAGASEGSSYTFTAATSAILGGVILTYRNAAYDASGAFAGVGFPKALPSVTASTTNCVLIGAAFKGGAGGGGDTIAPPGSMTLRSQNNDADSPSWGVGDEQLTASGATGTRSFTSTGSGTNSNGMMITIKPA